MEKRNEWRKLLLQTTKIAVGSSAAIYVAESMGLQYGASAGSIALLTLVTTKWETVKLSLYRVFTFGIAVALAAATIGMMESEWIAYGIYIFFLVGFCRIVGMYATVSVNAVIGTHFLQEGDFSYAFIWNEFLLVCIGITAALILNLFYDYGTQKKNLIRNQRETEKRLQLIMAELAAYMSGKRMQINVWERIRELEADLEAFIRDAYEYQDNTFHSHPGYYIDYFEMRARQLNILHNLHNEMRKIRRMPAQAKVVANFMLYLPDYVIELNSPEKQIRRLGQIFADMKNEPLPETREEFESRAVLYHILMDLEEFLLVKRRFVNGLDETRKKLYWEK